ncbi:MAG TPA: hypothetical protein VL486_16110 [Verrucomicrobiae bacterium]|nr:hypothetical protein [Verrucomicrobiae bacterium]
MEDIHDIKGLVPLPHSLWWLWLLLLVAAAAAFFWFKKRRSPPVATDAVAPLSPFEAAIRALRQLREENPPVEEFYTRLSDIVRRYLEGQLGLRAPERTTEEFLYEVSRDHALSPEHRELLEGFLQESDLVKFARFRPREEDKQRAFDAAEKFVNETRPTVAANEIRGTVSEGREEDPRLQVG